MQKHHHIHRGATGNSVDAARSVVAQGGPKVERKIRARPPYSLKHRLRKLDFTIQQEEPFKQESIILGMLNTDLTRDQLEAERPVVV